MEVFSVLEPYKLAYLTPKSDKQFYKLLTDNAVYNRQLFKNIYNLDIICGDELIINMIPLGNTFYFIVFLMILNIVIIRIMISILIKKNIINVSMDIRIAII